MMFKIHYTVAFILLVIVELLQYLVYILVAPVATFVQELWESLSAFPFRAIRFAWKRYCTAMKTGELPSQTRRTIS